LEAGITDQSLIHRLAPDRLVRLYRTNSEAGETVDFVPTAETRKWVAQLDSYNRFIAVQNVEIALTPADTSRLAGRMNESRKRGLPRLVRPDVIKTNLYRQFNEGSFGQGGRLYGAWWISCPKELRHLIGLNGKATVELDYSGCAIRMLYHEQGKECEADPYYLEALDACEQANGFPKGHFREDIKRMTQALINGRDGGHGELIRLAAGRSFKPHFSRPEVMGMIKDRHSDIANTFQTGAWGRLQRADSDIALAVVTNLTKIGIVALPIHDSFVVTKDDEAHLNREMVECYTDRFGYKPVINKNGRIGLSK
jgi:hypothetical protein